MKAKIWNQLNMAKSIIEAVYEHENDTAKASTTSEEFARLTGLKQTINRLLEK